MAQVSDVLKNIRLPERGWIRAVRDASGITGPQLAHRLGVSKQRISVLEKAEIEGGVSLSSMRQAAEALDCDLVYALLPRDQALADELLQQGSQEVAMDEVERIKSPEIFRAIAGICRKYNVSKLGMFGSAARRELTPESDIDLLVEFTPGSAPPISGLMAMQEELTGLLGRKADVATTSILRNPFRRKAILRELEELYAA